MSLAHLFNKSIIQFPSLLKPLSSSNWSLVSLFAINKYKTFNPIRAGGGGHIWPPPSVFYPHFSCVRARDLKFYDFLNNIKKNLVILFFCQKVSFCSHRALAKNGRKKAS